MFRSGWKLLLVGMVLAASLLMLTPDANAHWGGNRGWACGWGCYDPCLSSCGWSGCGWGYSSWRVGYRSCGWRGWGCCGGCGWTDCCGSVCGVGYSYAGSSCCGGGGAVVPGTSMPGTVAPTPAKAAMPPMPNEPTPATPMEPPATPPGMPTPGAPSPLPGGVRIESGTVPSSTSSNGVPTQENSGLLTVWVPYDAKVIVNGRQTVSTGSKRQFVSYGLKSGFSYKYEVRAEVVRNGELQTETRSITMAAGERASVAFGFNPKPQEEIAVALNP